MNDHELEDQLSLAAGQADGFFSRWSGENLRELVHRRVAITLPGGRGRFPTRWRRRGLVAVALVCLMVLAAGQIPGLLRSDEAGHSISQQMLWLNNRGLAHRINFFRVSQPGNTRQDLLAVIWAPRPGGGWQQVYSSLFEGVRDPQPAATIILPGERQQMVLISSLDKVEHYLHYRLLGFDDSRVITYREQDYVPQGRVEIRPGLLVESRVNRDIPGGKSVTNIIPYYIEPSGDLMVREDPLFLEEGQSLMLIGNDAGERVRVDTQGATLQPRGLEGYYTYGSGDAVLTMTPDDDLGRTRRLSIKVIGTRERDY